MSATTPPCTTPWGLLEWAITGLVTLIASVGAFVWRLTLRLETIEASLTRVRQDLDESRQASDAAARRLADGLGQLLDEHYRLREALGVLPTRKEIHDLDARIAERLDALTARLDRAIDP